MGGGRWSPGCRAVDNFVMAIRETTTIESLHDALFGFVPRKAGTAYERLAAVVLAGLGWVDVEHDRTERPVGRRADHQLDVVCRRADDTVRRLIVECKDWTFVVGQDVVNRLVGVRAQVGADAVAIVTREGFTKGALKVACDEDIAMVLLRPYMPAIDDGTWVNRIEMTLRFGFPIIGGVEFHTNVAADRELLRKAWTEEWIETRHLDGSPAETFGELWRRGETVALPDGSRRGTLSLPEGRLVECWDGMLVRIEGMDWTLRIAETEQTVVWPAAGPSWCSSSSMRTGNRTMARSLLTSISGCGASTRAARCLAVAERLWRPALAAWRLGD